MSEHDKADMKEAAAWRAANTAPQGVASLPTAYEWCSAQSPGWAVTRDWMAGWDAARAALAQAGQAAPAGEVASEPPMDEFNDELSKYHPNCTCHRCKAYGATLTAPSESEQTDSALPDGGAVEKDAARLAWALDVSNSLIYNPIVGKWRAFGDEDLNYFDTKVQAIDAAIDRAAVSKTGGA